MKGFVMSLNGDHYSWISLQERLFFTLGTGACNGTFAVIRAGYAHHSVVIYYI